MEAVPVGVPLGDTPHKRESDRYAIRTRNLQDWNLTRCRCANRSKASNEGRRRGTSRVGVPYENQPPSLFFSLYADLSRPEEVNDMTFLICGWPVVLAESFDGNALSNCSWVSVFARSTTRTLPSFSNLLSAITAWTAALNLRLAAGDHEWTSRASLR